MLVMWKLVEATRLDTVVIPGRAQDRMMTGEVMR